MTPDARRPSVDLLRIVAAHLIVWHHFALYSGMADAAWSLAPQAFGFLVDHARKAVQVFLVLAGFFAAQSLMAGNGAGGTAGEWMRAVARRFMRLAPMLWCALVVVLIVDATIGTGEAQPAWTTQVWRVAVHALLLQDVFGVPSLSPGLWYVAIDVQLFALAALLAWWGRAASTRVGMWIVAAAVVVSAWIFNRDASWDAWAPYFFAAYGLGMLAWGVAQRRDGATAAMVVAVIGVIGALGFDFRDRLLLALVVACALAVRMRVPSTQGGRARTSMPSGVLAAHANATYALFLLHDPVRRVVEAVWSRWVSAEPGAQALGLVVAWTASVVVAHAVTRVIDTRRGGARRSG